MKRYLSIFTLLLLSFSVAGQDILTKHSGETLTGDVQLLSNSDGMPYAVVKNGKDKETIKLFDISNISMEEFGLIKPMKIGEQYHFGLLVSEDYLSVYKYSNSNRMDDFGMVALQKFGAPAFALPGIMGFRKLMADYLSDCEEVSDKIEEKEFTRKDIDQIVADYNGCIALKNSINEQPASYYQSAAPKIAASKQSMLEDFETLLKYSEKVENKESATEMFSDLSSKLKKGEKVPDYLINALKGAIKNDSKLVELLNKIIEE
ncbi:hypothetical protein EV198_0465 [Roseivirga ehrenbergii]|uniref:DUF4369 domain-containing protein n=1 Tax=Roseivirga ehrenbergii (strain DSM 102268 / JCM 13514 / KCTC 12282 / NCIMB 14502 / KMM 6017) TaxID=279360 RepID=A0A150X8N2_ROSEK|nr:hypothetical protein [Roseivirga ehrenbergii]KYG75012.1 hypothetical protein MB14_07375 [Roseivirga ehrenbergii]TCL13635.1 hypothetical protein EV198_0465 [Roseivirga ehrenbergii]